MTVIVYVHTNKKNNKSYVGFTTKSIEKRWNEHVVSSTSSHLLFARAIRKHGSDEEIWEHRVVSEHDSVEEAKIAEEEHIALLKSNHREFGYNLTAGGDGVIANDEVKARMSASQRKRPPMSAETKKKIGDAHRGEKNANFGKKFSDETRRKLSESHKNPSQETREKLRQAHLGLKYPPRTEESKERTRQARKGKCVGSVHPMFNGHPKQKLTEEKVIEIKSTPATVSHQELADKFGVKLSCIYCVRVGRTWKHVRPDLTKDPSVFYHWHNRHTAKHKGNSKS